MAKKLEELSSQERTALEALFTATGGFGIQKVTKRDLCVAIRQFVKDMGWPDLQDQYLESRSSTAKLAAQEDETRG